MGTKEGSLAQDTASRVGEEDEVGAAHGAGNQASSRRGMG